MVCFFLDLHRDLSKRVAILHDRSAIRKNLLDMACCKGNNDHGRDQVLFYYRDLVVVFQKTAACKFYKKDVAAHSGGVCIPRHSL